MLSAGLVFDTTLTLLVKSANPNEGTPGGVSRFVSCLLQTVIDETRTSA